MSMTVNKHKDSKQPSIFVHKIADIPGGVTIDSTSIDTKFFELGYLPEGTPIAKANNGLYGIPTGEGATALAITGSNVKLEKNTNVTVDAWVAAVVRTDEKYLKAAGIDNTAAYEKMKGIFVI